MYDKPFFPILVKKVWGQSEAAETEMLILLLACRHGHNWVKHSLSMKCTFSYVSDYVCVCVCVFARNGRERLIEWCDINRSTDGEMDRWILMKIERQNKRDRKRLSLSLSVYPCLFSIFPLWPISGCHSIFHFALFSLTETYVNIKRSPSAPRSPVGHIHNH